MGGGDRSEERSPRLVVVPIAGELPRDSESGEGIGGGEDSFTGRVYEDLGMKGMIREN